VADLHAKFEVSSFVIASVSSVRHATNTGELAHANLNTLIFYSATRFTSNSVHHVTRPGSQDRVRD